MKKYYYNREEDVLKNTSAELNISEDKIKFVIRNFWKSLRSFLTSPLEHYQGILINGFGKFYINKKRVEQLYKYYDDHNINSPKLEYYKKLKEKLNED